LRAEKNILAMLSPLDPKEEVLDVLVSFPVALAFTAM